MVACGGLLLNSSYDVLALSRSPRARVWRGGGLTAVVCRDWTGRGRGRGRGRYGVKSNIIPPRFPKSRLGNGQELQVCRRCSCCRRSAQAPAASAPAATVAPARASARASSAASAQGSAPVAGDGTQHDWTADWELEIDCRMAGKDGRTANSTCGVSNEAEKNSVIGWNTDPAYFWIALINFPLNATVVRLNGGRDLRAIDWAALSSTGAHLKLLDVSGNDQLDPIPPTGFFAGDIYRALTSLKLAGTDLRRAQDDMFQHLNKSILAELDLSMPPPGKAPRPEVSSLPATQLGRSPVAPCHPAS